MAFMTHLIAHVFVETYTCAKFARQIFSNDVINGVPFKYSRFCKGWGRGVPVKRVDITIGWTISYIA
jgi:hypothetical protein